LIKTTVISSVSHFNLAGTTLLEGLSQQKSPRGDGIEFWAPCVARR